MKKLKKTIAIIMTLAFSGILLCGCDEEKSSSSEVETEATTEVTTQVTTEAVTTTTAKATTEAVTTTTEAVTEEETYAETEAVYYEEEVQQPAAAETEAAPAADPDAGCLDAPLIW